VKTISYSTIISCIFSVRWGPTSGFSPVNLNGFHYVAYRQSCRDLLTRWRLLILGSREESGLQGGDVCGSLGGAFKEGGWYAIWLMAPLFCFLSNLWLPWSRDNFLFILVVLLLIYVHKAVDIFLTFRSSRYGLWVKNLRKRFGWYRKYWYENGKVEGEMKATQWRVCYQANGAMCGWGHWHLIP
jgi:hypothetical protein